MGKRLQALDEMSKTSIGREVLNGDSELHTLRILNRIYEIVDKLLN